MAQLRGKIFDFERIVLFADGVEAGKRARMQFGGRDGYPRISVFTGAPGKEGIISGPMDYEAYTAFLEVLKDTAMKDGEDKVKITLRTNVWVDNKRTNEMKVVSELWVGKSPEGIVWLALTAEGYPKIQFEFQVSQYITLSKKDGVEYTKAETSKMMALSFVKVLGDMVSQYLMQISLEDRLTAPNQNGKASNESFDDITF